MGKMVANKSVLLVLGHFIGIFRLDLDLFKMMVGLGLHGDSSP